MICPIILGGLIMNASNSWGRLLACAVVIASTTLIAAGTDTPVYTLSTTTVLGAPDRWDYLTLDAASHRVYVSHGDRLTVVDGRSGEVIGQVTGFPGGTHGIAVSTENGKGYTDDGQAGTVGAFDLKTLSLLRSIPGRPDADGIALDSKSGHVFVSNGESNDVSVIDPKTDRNLGNIDAGGKLEFLVADGRGKVYVNGEQKEEIVRIDTKTNKVDAHWPMTDCRSPHGLAMDTATRRLFVSCVNSMLVVLSADDGHEVAHLPIGLGTDGVAFDPVRKRIFSSNGRDGTITMLREIDADHYAAIGDIKTGATARTMTIDPGTGRLYVAMGEIDATAPAGGRPKVKGGSLKLLFLDPSP
jgi:YVTN family beta-propeller protein